jgi:uncharacterized protein YciI
MSEPNYYVIIATDQPDTAPLRQAVRAHRAYLRNQVHVRICAAGPLVDEPGEKMTGTFILCAADALAAVQTFIAEDPYSRSGLFGEIAVSRLDWTLGNPVQAQAEPTPVR